MTDEYIESTWKEKDSALERQLRPSYLADFIGHDSLKTRLDVVIQAAKQREEPLHHILFYGPPGLGKTTLSTILAKEMNANLVVTSGPSLEKPSDLAGILSNLSTGDVLFIDEIHRMPRAIEEYLYPALEDFKLDLLLESGPQARSVQIQLNQFTLVGATTRLGLLSAPLRSRFGFHCKLDYYTPETISAILNRSAQILGLTLDSETLLEIAHRSRGTPRIANNLLRWVRDFALIKNNNKLNSSIAHRALEMLNIDHRGLDELDKKILTTLIDHHRGGPVGLSTLAAAVGEEPTTLSEVSEPFLMMQGLLRRTKRGREATSAAYEHFGLDESEVKGKENS